MSRFRHLPPVHSPTSLPAVARGFAGALAGDPFEPDHSLIRHHWRAAGLALTDSGTSALRLAISATIPAGGVVALPAWGCYDLATAADGANVRVALYDVDPATLGPDFDSLARALALGAHAVVVAHFFGMPVDMDRVAGIARPAGAQVIEDAAQGIGGSWRGAPLGSHGDLAVLSFGRGKGLNGGGGGALLANTAAAGQLIEPIRHALPAGGAGWGAILKTKAQWLLARPSLYAIPTALPFLRLGETIYHPPHEPTHISRASAAMLRSNWPRAFAEPPRRRLNADRLNNAVATSSGWTSVKVAEAGEPGYLRLPILAGGHSDRDRQLNNRSARLGVVRGYAEPLSSLPGFRDRCVNAASAFPGADRLARSLATLPTHSLLTENDLDGIEHWLTDGP